MFASNSPYNNTTPSSTITTPQTTTTTNITSPTVRPEWPLIPTVIIMVVAVMAGFAPWVWKWRRAGHEW